MKNNLYQEFIVPLKHSFRIMRNAFLALFLFVGATYATESYSQNMRVTVMSAGISTGQVLNEIESQTDYLFVYDVKEVNLDRRVDIHAENRPVSEVLDEVFEGTDVVYAMEGKNIMLMHRSKENATLVPEQQTQGHTVKGLVTDVEGEPIIGANIKVEGTSAGTITDLEGRFTIDVPDNAVLQVSYIGYISQNVKYNHPSDRRHTDIRRSRGSRIWNDEEIGFDRCCNQREFERFRESPQYQHPSVFTGNRPRVEYRTGDICRKYAGYIYPRNKHFIGQQKRANCIGRDYIYRIFIVSKP